MVTSESHIFTFQTMQELMERDPSTLDVDMSVAAAASVRQAGHLEVPSVAASSADGAAQQMQTETSGGQSSRLSHQIGDDKKFPKCRICNYRYFTRLDLCRHFVDFHLRDRLSQCMDPSQTRCPACTLTYDRKQTRLRHFIWSHQDLEALVMETKGTFVAQRHQRITKKLTQIHK